jgi:hypothetical protein
MHLLVNSAGGLQQYDGMVVGQIVAHCNDTPILVTDLQLGRDLREWHTLGDVVSSATQAREVWSGAMAGGQDETGHIDLLSVDLPALCQEGRLNAVEIVDTSRETTNALDPALRVVGITVEYAE